MSELSYREALREKLLDLSGELKVGRDSFSHNSGLYNHLEKSIADVVKILDEHSGEETLSPAVRTELEEKLQIMHEQAVPYRDLKLAQGAYDAVPENSPREAERLRVVRIRCQAAEDLLKIDTKIPKDPGAEHGIIAPAVLEPGDRLETDWRLRWKQNVSYLAKKQLRTGEKALRQYERPAELTQDEFNTLMDLSGQGNILAYKDDAQLCQKYPKLRLTLEKAVNASRKLSRLSENEMAAYLAGWTSHAVDKATKEAKKEKQRKGQPFTEEDREKLEAKLEIRLQDKLKKFGSAEKLAAAGDVLEQMARFADLKMKVISDRNYVKYPHTNTLGNIFSVKDYEGLIRTAATQKEKEFYRNLRDLRELEDAGIRHIKPAEMIDKAFYRKVDESVYKTVKKDFLSFKSAKPGFQGAVADNSNYGATDSSTVNKMVVGQNSKFRVGKIGLKLHSKHKHLQVSGSTAFGQVKTGMAIGASLNKAGAEIQLSGEAALVRARIKAQASRAGFGASVGANASVGHVSGKLTAGIGSVKVTGDDGKEHNEWGVTVKAGAVAAAVKGGGGGTLNLFGLKIGLSFTGYAGAVGADFGFRSTLGGVGLSLGGALGIGAGLKLTVNWTGLVKNVKNLWRKSRLAKLIANYKEKKKEHEKEAFRKAKENIREKPKMKEDGGMKEDRVVKDDFDIGAGKHKTGERRGSVPAVSVVKGV